MIANDNPSFFYWGYNFNVDWLDNLWMVSKDRHTVFYISKEKETWNAIFKVAGKEGVAGQRNGNIAKATFNQPESLCVYNYNHTAALSVLHMFPIYLTNPTSLGCNNSNYDVKNYTKCGVKIDDKFPYKIVNHTRV